MAKAKKAAKKTGNKSKDVDNKVPADAGSAHESKAERAARLKKRGHG